MGICDIIKKEKLEAIKGNEDGVMHENLQRYSFSIIKTGCLFLLYMYFFLNSEKSLREISVEWFLFAMIFAVSLGVELSKRYKVIFLYTQIVLVIVCYFIFQDNLYGLFLCPMIILDFVVYYHLKFYWSCLIFVTLILQMNRAFELFVVDFFVLLIYFQKYVIIEKYERYLDDFEKREFQLKDSIDLQSHHFKKEMEENALSLENQILEEKTRLSQALHDKLGHSINGSIFQLEACKILVEKEPEKSIQMLQAVIDNLRTSMDEIRFILRKERPDKKCTALLQLHNLAKECRKKYNIEVEISFHETKKVISDEIWEVILDNIFEAITNALKYAKCTKISIEIRMLNKIIRCNIKDNGIGCLQIKDGMGLSGMKERTRKIKGYLDIEGKDGFCVNMILPLEMELEEFKEEIKGE